MYDLIIIGAGPAGLAAAIYAARAELNFIVIEKEPISGGQIINTSEVDNYPGLYHLSGFELADKMKDHATILGTDFRTGTVTHIETVPLGKRILCEDGQVYESKTVLLAGGAKYRLLGVPGEKELTGMGVSYCATCDGAFFRNKTVAVVGGGDVAIEDALFLSRICAKVYLIHRRDTFRAAKTLVSKLKATENVEFLYQSTVQEIHGKEMVDSITVLNKESGERKQITINGIFIAVGILPQTDGFKDLLKLDEGGYIVADETCETSDPAVFAAGDIRTKQLRQVITAAADGANAITSVERYLNCI